MFIEVDSAKLEMPSPERILDVLREAFRGLVSGDSVQPGQTVIVLPDGRDDCICYSAYIGLAAAIGRQGVAQSQCAPGRGSALRHRLHPRPRREGRYSAAAPRRLGNADYRAHGGDPAAGGRAVDGRPCSGGHLHRRDWWHRATRTPLSPGGDRDVLAAGGGGRRLPELGMYRDYRGTCPDTAGDMQLAQREGVWQAGSVRANLPELLTGAPSPDASGRRYFRAAGLAVEDIIALLIDGR